MGNTDHMATSADLRASDQDRQRVIDALRAEAGQGRLTLDELGERIEETYSAKMLSELSSPSGPMRELPPLSPPLRPPTATFPGYNGPPSGYQQRPGDGRHPAPGDPWGRRGGSLAQLIHGASHLAVVLAIGIPLLVLLTGGFMMGARGGGIAPLFWLVVIGFWVTRFARSGCRSQQRRNRGGPSSWF
jgi:hypothetical protein